MKYSTGADAKATSAKLSAEQAETGKHKQHDACRFPAGEEHEQRSRNAEDADDQVQDPVYFHVSASSLSPPAAGYVFASLPIIRNRGEKDNSGLECQAHDSC